jgi:hypothetical protein
VHESACEAVDGSSTRHVSAVDVGAVIHEVLALGVRNASHPGSATLNYAYAMLENQIRIQVTAAGLFVAMFSGPIPTVPSRRWPPRGADIRVALFVYWGVVILR